MTLPGVRQSFTDGALGLGGTSADLSVKIGLCTGGVANTAYLCSSPQDAISNLGGGLLAEAVAHGIQFGKKPVIAIKAAQSAAGTLGSITKDGDGPAIADNSSVPLDAYELLILVTKAGFLGTARVKYSLDGGDTYSPEVASAATLSLGDSGISVAMTAAPSAVTASGTSPPTVTASGTPATDDLDFVVEIDSVDTLSAVTAAGTTPPTVTVAGTPASSAYSFRIEVTTGGNRGTALFRWSSDGGSTWTSGVTTAATTVLGSTGVTVTWATGSAYTNDNIYTWTVVGKARGTATFRWSSDGGDTWTASTVTTGATNVLGATGITIAFATGTYYADDAYAFTAQEYVVDTVYSATCTPPSFDSTSLAAAIDVAKAYAKRFRQIHVVGAPADEGALATLAASVSAQMVEAEDVFRYAYIVLEAPDDAVDADLIDAFDGVVAPRVVVAAGSAEVLSALKKASASKRSAAWSATARIMLRGRHKHPGDEVGTKPLPDVLSLYRDEALTEGLNDARFLTLRTFVDQAGAYVTDAPTMSLTTSDFSSVMNQSVMDRAAELGYDAMLKYVNADVDLQADGTIDPVVAAEIEKQVLSKLRGGLLGTNGIATAVEFTIDRTNNVASTTTLLYKVRVRPKGYAREVEGEYGFQVPAFAA